MCTLMKLTYLLLHPNKTIIYTAMFELVVPVMRSGRPDQMMSRLGVLAQTEQVGKAAGTSAA